MSTFAAYPDPEEARRFVDASSTCGTILVILWLVTLGSCVRLLLPQKEWDGQRLAPSTVNPNLAPWWELTALPGIGEATARKIIEYREAHADRSPVFRRPEDLEPVPGIGPKTIRRISSHLRFND